MIITAVKNEEINLELKEVYGKEVYLYDLYSYEDVISLVKKCNEEAVQLTLITREKLDGNMSFEEYIKEVRKVSKNIRIIIILDRLNSDIKSFLFSNEVFEIIEGNLISIDKIIEILNSKQKIIYKQDNVQNKVTKIENESIVIAKEMVAVYGTSGAGKSLFATLLSDKLSKVLNINTALLDMDVQNPSIDILANLDGDNNILTRLVEDVDKRGEISDIITKYLIKDRQNNNLSYMTNNVTLFECQNKLSNKYYEKIYSSVNKNYDYVVADLPSSPFLDIVPYTLEKATKIFFVINANYISIRQAIKYLELMTKLWSISKDKISIIVNKVKKNSLDLSQIRSLLPEYNIVCTVSYSDDIEAYINGVIPVKKLNINIDNILRWLNIKSQTEKKMFNFYSLLKKVGQKIDN